MASFGDDDYLRLSFKHLSWAEIDGFEDGKVSADELSTLVDDLAQRLQQPDLNFRTLRHNGFKDFTEGPSEDTPVLLRQDAYKALTEPVTFTNPDGSTTAAEHTARFGEIEQRFYATTPMGRALYDRCLAEADAVREQDPTLPTRDFAAYEVMYATPFRAFPKTLAELIAGGYVHARYSPTPAGLAAKGTIKNRQSQELVRLGYVRAEGLRYEDFLPVSAAGIFASNLSQYGTKSTASERPVYTQVMLEEIMGKRIVDAAAAYQRMEDESLTTTIEQLGIS